MVRQEIEEEHLCCLLSRLAAKKRLTVPGSVVTIPAKDPATCLPCPRLAASSFFALGWGRSSFALGLARPGALTERFSAP